MPGAEPRPPFRAWPWGRSQRQSSGAQASHTAHGPTRAGRPDEVHMSIVAPDPFCRLTLALMRWHFQTFAAPETQGWLMALRYATTHVGPRTAGVLCYDVVALVQVLRSARASPFRFNPEGCALCRVWLTPEERRLLDLLDALRNGQTGRAKTLIQMLCDGVPSDDLYSMAEIYLHRHAPDFTQPADPVSASPKGH